MDYPASELVLDGKGNVYHLGLNPSNLSTKIILVGDQDRVALISSFFDEVECKIQHREFVTHTGIYKGKRISVVSTGIGTDNIDIVMNELDALVNIDLEKRENKPTHTSLELVRIGTCGILQRDIDLYSYLISEGCLGLDNIAHFYEIPFTEEELSYKRTLVDFLSFPAAIRPYFIQSDTGLNEKLISENTKSGFTITSSGFYGPQGRQLRLKAKLTHINDRVAEFECNGKRIINFEMESSALLALSKAMGHRATTICLGIANRQKMEFSKDFSTQMNDLINYVLERI